MTEKFLYIVGGPNGAGKTTLIRRILRSTTVEYLSADLIAAKLSPDNVSLAQISAGREFVWRLNKCLDDGVSVLVESTLSGKSLRRAIEKARILGLPRRGEILVHRFR